MERKPERQHSCPDEDCTKHRCARVAGEQQRQPAPRGSGSENERRERAEITADHIGPMRRNIAADRTDDPKRDGDNGEGRKAMQPGESIVTQNPKATDTGVRDRRHPGETDDPVDPVTPASQDINRAERQHISGGDNVAGNQWCPELHTFRIGPLSSGVHQDSEMAIRYPGGYGGAAQRTQQTIRHQLRQH